MTTPSAASTSPTGPIVILFASRYGHTRRYAEWLADDLRTHASPSVEPTTSERPLSVELVDVTDAKRLADLPELPANASAIVGMGANYAGHVQGMELIADAARRCPDAPLTIVTVAWTSPEQTGTIERLHENAIPADLLPRTQRFHLRGGIDHTRLTLTHKAGMAALKAFILSKPASKRTPDDEETLEHFGGAKDFTDRASLAPVLESILAQR